MTVLAKYRIVPGSSRVWVDAKSSVHAIKAEGDGLEGHVDLEPDESGAADSTRPTAGQLTFHVSRLSTGKGLEDREIQRLVDSRRYPTIEGSMASSKALDGNGAYRVAGDISCRGTTHRVEDQMQVDFVDDRTVRLTGQSRFDIRDYGMKPPKILMMRVEPYVDVRVEIVAEKEA